MFGDAMNFFSGGKQPEIQMPQVATHRDEPHPTGRTEPMSDAEFASIEEAEEAERRRQAGKKGQSGTILTGSLGTPADEESAAQRKTLLGA